MGSSISFTCKNCAHDDAIFFGGPKTRWSFSTGIGMLYSPRNVFYEDEGRGPMVVSLIRSQKIKAEVSSRLEAGWAPEGDYGHEIYMCAHCMDFHERFHFTLKSGDEAYEPQYPCPKCRIELTLVTLVERGGEITLVDSTGRAILWRCPICGSRDLVLDENAPLMEWD